MFKRILIIFLLALFCYVTNAQAQQEFKVLAEDAAQDDSFGYSVAISGNYAVVGASMEDGVDAPNAGAAYILVRTEDGWIQQAKITNPTRAANDRFGWDVDIDGDYIIVGASYDDNGSGSAQIFSRQGNNWNHQASLTASDRQLNDIFGYSVAISGDHAIVGAYTADHSNVSDPGAAYIFIRNENGWIQQQKIVASDPEANDFFGYDVDITENNAVVCAYCEDPGGVQNAGSAYVFEKTNGENWVQVQKLFQDQNDCAANDHFGNTVAINRNYILVGAAYDDFDDQQDAGAVYVFVPNDNGWTLQQKLTAEDPALSYNFGYSVSICDNTILASAFATDENDNNSGTAFIFLKEGEEWQESTKLNSSDAEEADYFGYSVCIDGNYGIVSAPYSADNGPSTGSVYLYDLAWQIDITASAGGQQDSDNYVAGKIGATFGYDIGRDRPEVPHAPNNFIQLTFPHEEWQHNLFDQFTTDVVPLLAYLDGSVEWEFEVNSDLENENVTLSFLPDYGLPEELNLALVDRDIDRSFNLRSENTYIYNNGDTEKHNFALILNDEVSPEVEVVFPTEIEVFEVGDEVTIEWIASDANNITGAPDAIQKSEVQYSVDGGTEWIDISTTYGNDYDLQWTIPDLYSPFCKIKVTAYDGSSNSSVAMSNEFFVIRPIDADFEFSEGYSLVSLPIFPMQNDIEFVFGEREINSPHYYEVLDFLDGRGPALVNSVDAGPGYWLVANSLKNVEFQGEARIESFTHHLNQGWNLLGVPFLIDIPLTSVEIVSGDNHFDFQEAVDNQLIAFQLFDYNNGSNDYAPVELFQKWHGYYFWVIEPNLDMIVSPVISEDNGLAPEELAGIPSDNWWRVTIEARMQDAMDLTTTLGVDEQATNEYDAWLDTQEPPRQPKRQYLSSYFEHEEWDPKYGLTFNSDIRSPLENGVGEWEMHVSATQNQEIILSWPDFSYTVPDNYIITLLDTETNQEINLREEETYTFSSNGGRDFIIRANGGELQRSLTIPLHAGWNMISINVTPDDDFRYEEGQYAGELSVYAMMEQLRIDDNAHNLILLKNESGNFYAPLYNEFNNIPFWDVTEGYMVKVISDCEVTWFGTPIDASQDIPIDEGWNMISYFPTYSLPVQPPDFYAISDIIENVVLLKDVEGNFATPEFWYSNLPSLHEGQGYQINVNANVVLNYPGAVEVENLASVQPKKSAVHWSNPVRTNINMSVLVNSVFGSDNLEGSQIAAFDSHQQLVGLGTIDSDGRCGLSVWGDDKLTCSVKDGLINGEEFSLMIWDAKTESEQNLNVVKLNRGSGLVFNTNDFIVVDLALKGYLPERYSLAEVYPNPFNSTINITYGLPEKAQLAIQVFDVSGRLIATIVDGEISAGLHTAIWDGHGITSGVYFIRMETTNFQDTRKVTLVR